jgi:hypothetical protein
MSEQIGDVLEYEVVWLPRLEYGNHILKKVSMPRAIEPLLLTRLGEWLTRKASAKNIELRYLIENDFADVPCGPDTKVEFVGILKDWDNLTGKNALPTETGEGKVEAAKAGI